MNEGSTRVKLLEAKARLNGNLAMVHASAMTVLLDSILNLSELLATENGSRSSAMNLVHDTWDVLVSEACDMLISGLSFERDLSERIQLYELIAHSGISDAFIETAFRKVQVSSPESTALNSVHESILPRSNLVPHLDFGASSITTEPVLIEGFEATAMCFMRVMVQCCVVEHHWNLSWRQCLESAIGRSPLDPESPQVSRHSSDFWTLVSRLAQGLNQQDSLTPVSDRHGFGSDGVNSNGANLNEAETLFKLLMPKHQASENLWSQQNHAKCGQSKAKCGQSKAALQEDSPGRSRSGSYSYVSRLTLTDAQTIGSEFSHPISSKSSLRGDGSTTESGTAEYAVKRIDFYSKSTDRSSLKAVFNEVLNISKLGSEWRFVVTLRDYYPDYSTGHYCLLMPWLPATLRDLSSMASKYAVGSINKTLSAALAVLTLSQVFQAVEFIHSKGIIHLDIKCDNILLDVAPLLPGELDVASHFHNTAWSYAGGVVSGRSTFLVPRAVLSDFGSSIVEGSKIDSDSVPGSEFVRAPELLGQTKGGSSGTRTHFGRTGPSQNGHSCLNIPVTPKCDVWSLGCLIYEVFSGAPLFDCELNPRPYMWLMSAMAGQGPSSLARGIASVERETDSLDELGSALLSPMIDIFGVTLMEAKEIAMFMSSVLIVNPDQRLTSEGAMEAFQAFYKAFFSKWVTRVPEHFRTYDVLAFEATRQGSANPH